jgi:hypothetical protein
MSADSLERRRYAQDDVRYAVNQKKVFPAHGLAVGFASSGQPDLESIIQDALEVCDPRDTPDTAWQLLSIKLHEHEQTIVFMVAGMGRSGPQIYRIQGDRIDFIGISELRELKDHPVRFGMLHVGVNPAVQMMGRGRARVSGIYPTGHS